MPTEILMPALSPTMEEGTLAKWLVKEGDTVNSGDIMAEIETDKATMEFEAVDEGTIGKILIAEGSEGVKVNTPIAILLEEGESADDIADAAPAAAAPAQAAAEPQQVLDRTSGELTDTMPAAAAMSMDSYTVVRGDNLWNISGKSSIYGDPYQWPLIYKANRTQIKDPDLIFPGQNFDIDRNATAAEIDAAVNHARTRGAWSVGDVEQADLDYLAR